MMEWRGFHMMEWKEQLNSDCFEAERASIARSL